MKDLWRDIEGQITDAIGETFRVTSSQSIGGGCINEAFCIEGDRQRFFIKLNDASQLDMFEAEAAGLEAIRASDSLRAPRPIARGISGSRSWLALEHVDFGAQRNSTSKALGQQLAQMHRCSAGKFGWRMDNTIGATPQPNPRSGDWVEFWRDQRLGFQLTLAAERGAPNGLLEAGQALLGGLETFFSSYHPQPSLLHGDLWGGNWGADESGSPVIFDPAVYFGDREADLAMTELFGGFDETFYRAYNDAWELDPGYTNRKSLYNLYHVLNHFNLFGGGYATQARGMIDRLLAQRR